MMKTGKILVVSEDFFKILNKVTWMLVIWLLRLRAAALAPKKCIDRPLSAKKKEKNSLRGKQSFLLCQFFLLSLYSLALVCVPVLQGHEGCLSRLLLLLGGRP